MNKESYTAASSFPSKLLHTKVVEDGKIIPVHAQLSPTNKCNLDCEFCSCSDRQKSLEMTLDEVKNVLDVLANHKTESLTITGGGEPMMYPKINEIIDYADVNCIEVGLVTNGTLLDKLKHHDNLTWCRVSSSDDRIPSYQQITKAVKINPETDFAFSHVISRNPNYEIIKSVIDYANAYDFTHVRLVSDLCDLEKIPNMEEVKRELRKIGIDDNKVIYQGRKGSTRGIKDCYLSLLKPVISTEGIFPCCGSQYSIQGQKRDMVDRMKMGEVKDLVDIIDNQKYFDGSICDICFYSQYNESLKKLLNKPDHLSFV